MFKDQIKRVPSNNSQVLWTKQYIAKEEFSKLDDAAVVRHVVYEDRNGGLLLFQLDTEEAFLERAIALMGHPRGKLLFVSVEQDRSDYGVAVRLVKTFWSKE